MSHYLLELVLWLLAAYFIGCLLGAFARSRIAPYAPATADAVPADTATAMPLARTDASREPITTGEAITTGEPARASRPRGIEAPRQGAPDDLQRISGVGPVLERTLHGLGFFHYDQIAAWSVTEVAWVNEHLNFKGRIEREEWVEQARLLAAGDEQAFARLYGTGGLQDSAGETRSGTRTRRSGRGGPEDGN